MAVQSLSQLVKEALEIRSDNFVKTVENATTMLTNEKGRVGNMNIIGKLVKLKPSGNALIIGDLHGDLESLVEILQKSNYLTKMTENSDHLLIFLGDYGDRGPFSAEVHYIVLKLKLLFPKQVILMRGNHEGPVDLQAVPHDLPATFEARFGKGWQEAYDGVRELHQHLYLAVLVENQYLLIHGGLPSTANTIADLADAHKTHPKERILEDMLWSDPDDSIERLYPSPRGAGKLFDQNTTDKALDRFGVKILIRGHEASPEGYQISHKGKILTLFSRKGPPYFNAYGAYLELNLSEKVENAAQLVPYIHKF